MLGITVSASPQWVMEGNNHPGVTHCQLMKLRNWKKATNFLFFLPPENEMKKLYEVH